MRSGHCWYPARWLSIWARRKSRICGIRGGGDIDLGIRNEVLNLNSMFDCPLQTQTSPTSFTFFNSITFLPETLSTSGPPAFSFFSVTIHLPPVAVVETSWPRNDTVTFSPSSAQPQTVTLAPLLQHQVVQRTIPATAHPARADSARTHRHNSQRPPTRQNSTNHFIQDHAAASHKEVVPCQFKIKSHLQCRRYIFPHAVPYFSYPPIRAPQHDGAHRLKYKKFGTQTIRCGARLACVLSAWPILMKL